MQKSSDLTRREVLYDAVSGATLLAFAGIESIAQTQGRIFPPDFTAIREDGPANSTSAGW